MSPIHNSLGQIYPVVIVFGHIEKFAIIPL